MIEYIIGGVVALAVIFIASSSSADADTSVEDDDTTSKTPGALPGSAPKKPAATPPPKKTAASADDKYDSGMSGKQDESNMTPAVGPGGYGPFFPQEAGAGSKKDVIGDTYDASIKGLTIDHQRLATVRGRASKRG